MALPKLEIPNYETVLPSTGKKIKFRPFLVKEHKILLTVVDASAEEIARVVTELVDVCTFNALNINKLSHFDIEYLFLKIRSKSIGEVVKLIKACDNCSHKFEFDFNIDNIRLDKEVPKELKIQVSSNLGVVMRYPTFNEILSVYDNFTPNNIMDMICSCIDAVYDSEDFYGKDSFTTEEITEFVNNLTKEQFEVLEKFFVGMPRLIHEQHVECPSCSTDNKIVLEGLQNFFV